MAIIPDSVLQGPSDDSLAANEATEIDEIRLARKYKKDDLKRKQRFKMHAHIAATFVFYLVLIAWVVGFVLWCTYLFTDLYLLSFAQVDKIELILFSSLISSTASTYAKNHLHN